MSDGSAWEREALSIKQVPSLQALLRCCDERLLVRAIVEEHAVLAGDWDALPAKRKRAAEKRLAATLATMRGLPLDKKGARGSLLLPHESFVLHARSGLIERHVSAALLSLDDVPLARRAVQRSDAATPPGEAEGPQPRPYTLDPWERTLASRVWLGGSRCCRERYLVLAAAFWEMTYFGFEYERVCARRAEEKARRLVGKDVPGERPSEPPRTVSDERRRQAEGFGLVEPDRFELDYRDSMIVRVAQLNDDSRKALWLLLLDVAWRAGRGSLKRSSERRITGRTGTAPAGACSRTKLMRQATSTSVISKLKPASSWFMSKVAMPCFYGAHEHGEGLAAPTHHVHGLPAEAGRRSGSDRRNLLHHGLVARRTPRRRGCARSSCRPAPCPSRRSPDHLAGHR